MLFNNPIIFAVIAYALTALIALMVAGIITVIHWAVTRGGPKEEGGAAQKE